jgi:hypothetical protein
MTRTAVDLGELVKGVAENLRVLAEERHQTFSVDVAGHDHHGMRWCHPPIGLALECCVISNAS